jgi:uncharacterized protein YgbK (DUF1537 family)
MSERLARLASAAMQQVVVSQVFAEGGATAACLLRELGSHQLSVVGEWAPGVVMLQPGGRKGPRLTLKPGSYTWPDAIQDKLVRGGVRTGGAFHEPLL